MALPRAGGEARHPAGPWRGGAVASGGGAGGGGGARGGDGGARRIRFREAMTAAILSGHRKVAPYGMAGGEPGAAGRNHVERADGGSVELGGTDRIDMRPGDVFVIETPGGGGFGRVAERKE